MTRENQKEVAECCLSPPPLTRLASLLAWESALLRCVIREEKLLLETLQGVTTLKIFAVSLLLYVLLLIVVSISMWIRLLAIVNK